MIRQRDPLGLWSLSCDSERCTRQREGYFVLDNIFALIDEYICADLSIHSSLFPCSQTADHTFSGTPILEVLSRVAKFAIRGRSSLA
jgi:hypothetical protein